MENENENPVAEIREQLSTLYQRILDGSTETDHDLREAYQALSLLVDELDQADHQIKRSYDELMQARQQLEEERTRYQELFEFAPDAYLVTNTYGKILNANQAAAHLFNVRQDYLVQKPLNLFMDSHDWKTISRVLSKGAVHAFECVLLPRDSAPVHAAVKLAVVYNALHDPIALRWLLRDISDQKRAQQALTESEARFRTIFEGAETGMILTDLAHIILESNPAFDAMLGMAGKGLHGVPIASLMTQGEPPLTENIKNALLNGSITHYQGEQRFRHINGQTVWTRLTVSLLKNAEQPQYLVYLVENITAQKQTQEELDEMKRRLQNSSEVERIFLARELHDGPMQDLYGAVFKLSMEPDQATPEEIWGNIIGAKDILKQVASTLRAICGELRPPTLENLGLEKAIRAHAEKLQDRHPEINIVLNLITGHNLSPGA